MLVISWCHFFHLPEHGQAKGDESSEAEENVSHFFSQSECVYIIKHVKLT